MESFAGVDPANSINCVKGEIHNMLTVMRLNARWASGARFRREIPLQAESRLRKQFSLTGSSLFSSSSFSSHDC